VSNCPFCNLDPPPTPRTPPAHKGLFHRAWKGTHWLVPSLFLVFMPKCPMCIVAYVALFTGIGISLSTAHWIEILMWALCGVSLVYLAITRIPLFLRSKNVYRTSHAR
jgi:hypothetical protein